jgi:hypothetical protein
VVVVVTQDGDGQVEPQRGDRRARIARHVAQVGDADRAEVADRPAGVPADDQEAAAFGQDADGQAVPGVVAVADVGEGGGRLDGRRFSGRGG